MFIPKIRTKVNPKLLGTLVDPKSKRAYNGKYVVDYKGRIFKGETVNSKSEQLEFVPDQSAINKEIGIKHVYVKPTPEDYSKGFFIRYFIKDSRIGKVFEIEKPEYLKFTKEKKPYRRTAKMQWLLKGPAEPYQVGKYMYPGTAAKNADASNKVNKILPGIVEQILKNSAEFII
jgi:hypothetical protein